MIPKMSAMDAINNSITELLTMSDTEKAKPLKLVVKDCPSLSNSTVYLSQTKMNDRHIWNGVNILVSGNDGRETVCTVKPSDDKTHNQESNTNFIGMNLAVRNKLGVAVADRVTINFDSIKHGNKVYFRPLSYKGNNTDFDIDRENFLEAYLLPYFYEAYRPVHEGDAIIVERKFRTIEFQVVKTDPSPFCVVYPGTHIFCLKHVDVDMDLLQPPEPQLERENGSPNKRIKTVGDSINSIEDDLGQYGPSCSYTSVPLPVPKRGRGSRGGPSKVAASNGVGRNGARGGGRGGYTPYKNVVPPTSPPSQPTPPPPAPLLTPLPPESPPAPSPPAPPAPPPASPLTPPPPAAPQPQSLPIPPPQSNKISEWTFEKQSDHLNRIQHLLEKYQADMNETTALKLNEWLGRFQRIKKAALFHLEPKSFVDETLNLLWDDSLLWDITELLEHLEKNDESLKLNNLIFLRQFQTYGPTNEKTISALFRLANCHYNKKDYINASLCFKKVFQRRNTLLGKDHKDTLKAAFYLGRILKNQEKPHEALKILQKVCEAQEITLGPDHEETLDTQFQIAICFRRVGKYKEAMDLYTILWSKHTQMMGSNHKPTLSVLLNIGVVLQAQGKLEKALDVFQKVYHECSKYLGPDNRLTKMAFKNVSTVEADLLKKKG